MFAVNLDVTRNHVSSFSPISWDSEHPDHPGYMLPVNPIFGEHDDLRAILKTYLAEFGNVRGPLYSFEHPRLTEDQVSAYEECLKTVITQLYDDICGYPILLEYHRWEHELEMLETFMDGVEPFLYRREYNCIFSKWNRIRAQLSELDPRFEWKMM